MALGVGCGKRPEGLQNGSDALLAMDRSLQEMLLAVEIPRIAATGDLPNAVVAVLQAMGCIPMSVG
jgi:hypothetical protein